MPKIRPDYDDIFYTACLIEYVSRETKNHRYDVTKAIGLNDIRSIAFLSDTYHCLSFEQVAEEMIQRYNISNGAYDTISTCKYTVPSHLVIGAVYAKLAKAVQCDGALLEALYEVMTSEITDAISDFNSAFYYSASNQIEYEYKTKYAQR